MINFPSTWVDENPPFLFCLVISQVRTGRAPEGSNLRAYVRMAYAAVSISIDGAKNQ